MEPNQQLIDELFRAKVERARAMSPEEKLWAGPRLFEMVCEVMRAGIRDEYPAADEDEVRRMLNERIALWRKIESGA